MCGGSIRLYRGFTALRFPKQNRPFQLRLSLWWPAALHHPRRACNSSISCMSSVESSYERCFLVAFLRAVLPHGLRGHPQAAQCHAARRLRYCDTRVWQDASTLELHLRKMIIFGICNTLREFLARPATKWGRDPGEFTTCSSVASGQKRVSSQRRRSILFSQSI